MGPLLFTLFINDFQSCTDFFRFTPFADDSTISSILSRESDALINVHPLLISGLDSINDWLSANRIRLNVDKTKYMVFSYRGDYNLPPIKTGESTIENTDCSKFLGVFVDRHLSFCDHVNHISAKISKSIGVLNRINKFVPVDVMKSLYYSLIHPYISYVIGAWYGAPIYLRNKIDVLQRRAVRSVKSLEWNAHTKDHFAELGILTVPDVFELSMAVYMYRTIANDGEFDRDLYLYVVDSNFDHEHLTRNRDRLILPRYNRNKSKASLNFNAIKVWNDVPADVKSSASLSSFKCSYKRFIRSRMDSL